MELKLLKYVRVAGAIPSTKVSDCEYNTDHMISIAKEANRKKVQFLVFPELSITSSTCGDLFLNDILIQSAENFLENYIKNTINLNLVSILGAPIQYKNSLYNCAVIIQKGKILGVVPKMHLSNYNSSEEKRHFSSDNIFSGYINICGQNTRISSNLLFKSQDNITFGIEISSDLFSAIPPSTYHCIEGADIIFNLSAVPALPDNRHNLTNIVKQQSARCICGYVYTSSGFGESSTDLVFTGNCIIAENGEILGRSEPFSIKEQLIISELDIDFIKNQRRKNNIFSDIKSEIFYNYINYNLEKTNLSYLKRNIDQYPFIPSKRNSCKDIFYMQSLGLAKRLSHTGINSAIIGISGGLDSTLALIATVKTFDLLNIPRKNIHGVTMPGFGTTSRTYNNSHTLMQELQITSMEVDIKQACLQHFEDIIHDVNIHDVTYENAQARERTQILMDLGNKKNAIVIGTGDLSELALGWATYNGDHMSMYSINADIPKTLVKYLVQWEADNCSNKKVSEILNDIINTPISPELLPDKTQGESNQKTEDLVGPYELHDFFLYYFVNYGASPEKILFLAENAFQNVYTKEEILKWLKKFITRFFSQQFKRSCMPDGPKICSVDLSPRGGWHMPSDSTVNVWLEQLNQLS